MLLPLCAPVCLVVEVERTSDQPMPVCARRLNPRPVAHPLLVALNEARANLV